MSDEAQSRPSTVRSSETNPAVKQRNGHQVTPTPPMKGHAKFIRRNGVRTLNGPLSAAEAASTPATHRSSPTLSIDHFARTINYPQSTSSLSDRHHDLENDSERESTRVVHHRPPSSSTSVTFAAPPVKPRKSSTASLGSLVRPHSDDHHRDNRPIYYPDDDEEPNSLEGHGGQSDSDNDDVLRPERPDSRLSLRHDDDERFHHHQQQQQQQQTSNARLHRPHHRQGKQTNRNSMYDDYRFLDEQQPPALPSSGRSKQTMRSAINKELPQPILNRAGSGGSLNQATVAAHRLKSSSKSSSTESIPTLDLTVAGQKLFRTKHQTSDGFLSNSLPMSNGMRPPTGRLKPIGSAKSSSSYTDELPSLSTKTLEDVTNNGKASSPSSSSPNKAHLYKKKLAPIVNGNDLLNKKHSSRPMLDHQQSHVDDVRSDRSEETSTGTSNGGERDSKLFTNSDQRSKHH